VPYDNGLINSNRVKEGSHGLRVAVNRLASIPR
jgi:hypothetical protein